MFSTEDLLNPEVIIPTPKDETRKILKEVADKHKVTPEDILGDRRMDKIVWARWEFWHRLRVEKKWSNVKIAQVYDNDPTSIRYGIMRITNELPAPPNKKNKPNANRSN